jgi:DNA-binding winged helix-turn-helix (wHTH) protein
LPLLRFGPFELDTGARELRRRGLRVSVQPQPMTVLIALASRAGEVITRDELCARVWGGHTFVDFTRGLNFCVAQVRLALRDDASAPRFVETVPRRGYRFVAPVEVAAPAAPSTMDARAPARVPRHPTAWAAASAVGAALAVLVPLARGPLSPSSPPAVGPAYVRGLYHLRGGAAALPEATRWLERATREEPRSAEAFAALAAAYVDAAELATEDAAGMLARAEAAARAALARDPRHAGAHVSLAAAALYGRRDWAGGGQALRRAMALEPRSPRARRAWAAYRAALGDMDGALAAVEAAYRLDPVCVTLRGEVAWYRYAARRYADAAAQWRAGLGIGEPSGPHEGLFHVVLAAGRTREAAAEALTVMTLAGVPREAVDALARRPPAEVLPAFLSGAVAHLARDPRTAPERLAVLEAARGDGAAALALLGRACDRHAPALPRLLRDPAFDGLRGTAGFEAVRACVGLRPPSFSRG